MPAVLKCRARYARLKVAAAQPDPWEGEMAAPKRRQCGTQQVHERLLEMNPAFRERENRLSRESGAASNADSHSELRVN